MLITVTADTNFKKRQNTGEPPAKVPRKESSNHTKENKSLKEESGRSNKERRKSETSHEVVQYDKEGKKEIHITLSPKLPVSDAPEPEELIKALEALENAASSDGKVREQIAQLPPDVSDIASVAKISGNTEYVFLSLVGCN